MDINYELYKVFYYVAKTLSFSEASKQLFISQSAVSQSVKALEKKLDQTLFIRSTKKVRLTPEGEILFRHVEPAMTLIQKGEAQLLDTEWQRADSHWSKRHHMPVLSDPIPGKIPQSISSRPHQGNQRNLDSLRRAFGNWSGGSDCCKLPQSGSWKHLQCQKDLGISRRLYRQ